MRRRSGNLAAYDVTYRCHRTAPGNCAGRRRGSKTGLISWLSLAPAGIRGDRRLDGPVLNPLSVTGAAAVPNRSQRGRVCGHRWPVTTPANGRRSAGNRSERRARNALGTCSGRAGDLLRPWRAVACHVRGASVACRRSGPEGVLMVPPPPPLTPGTLMFGLAVEEHLHTFEWRRGTALLCANG